MILPQRKMLGQGRLRRQTDFFKRDCAENVFIAAKSTHSIQNLYARQRSFGIVISGNAFGKVLCGDSSFFELDIKSVSLWIIRDFHVSSFLVIINVDRYYEDSVFLFDKDWPNCPVFVEFFVPDLFKCEFFAAFQSAELSWFPLRCADCFFDFCLISAPNTKFFFCMLSESNWFRNIFHTLNISRLDVIVKRRRVT